MSDMKKTPAPAEKPTALPPTYEDANSQSSLPIRNGPSHPGMPPRGPFPLDIPVLNLLKGKRVVLASASPRRKQILSLTFPKLEIIPSDFPENLDKDQLGAFEYVLQTATEKCLSVYRNLVAKTPESIPDPALVIAGDTIIVTTAGRIIEKPRSEKDHIAMLRMLREQRTHKILTAIVVVAPRDDARHPGYNIESRVVETKVTFDHEASDELIEAYVKTREGVDKAGGYGIQGIGSVLMESVEGSWDNAMGMSLKVTLALAERAILNQGGDEEEEVEED